MSLVSGFPHHPVMHHHDSHYSFHAAAAAAAAAGRCGHDDVGPGGVGGGGGAGPYFTGWLISHADVSPTEYGLAAAGYSPEYQNSGGGGGSSAMDPHSHHHHHHHYGPGGGGGGGGGAIGGVPSHHGGGLSVNVNGMHPHNHPHHHPGRPVKRRPTANRKERRRTQSINSAFAELRECIPNVPADTKLSKIKTLRLATSYISYLMDILDKDGQHGDTEAFKADFKKTSEPGGKEERRKREAVEVLKTTAPVVGGDSKKTKGRTGWPQHVWALELKQ